jgi:hypothetical protein
MTRKIRESKVKTVPGFIAIQFVSNLAILEELKYAALTLPECLTQHHQAIRKEQVPSGKAIQSKTLFVPTLTVPTWTSSFTFTFSGGKFQETILNHIRAFVAITFY